MMMQYASALQLFLLLFTENIKEKENVQGI